MRGGGRGKGRLEFFKNSSDLVAGSSLGIKDPDFVFKINAKGANI